MERNTKQLIVILSLMSATFLVKGKNDFISYPDTFILKPNNIEHALEIEPYEVIWSQDVTEPDGKKRKGINTITDIVTIEKNKNESKVIQRTLKWEDVDNNIYIKSDRLDYQTLEPLSVDIRWNPNYVQHTDINGQQLFSTSLKNEFSESKMSVSQLEEKGFTWSSDGFALIAFAGKTDKIFALQTLSGLPHNPQLGRKNFEYQKDEQLKIEGIGTFNTKVLSDMGSSIKTTYWLADQKPYIVKVKFVQPEGIVTVWKLEEMK